MTQIQETRIVVCISKKFFLGEYASTCNINTQAIVIPHRCQCLIQAINKQIPILFNIWRNNIFAMESQFAWSTFVL